MIRIELSREQSIDFLVILEKDKSMKYPKLVDIPILQQIYDQIESQLLTQAKGKNELR